MWFDAEATRRGPVRDCAGVVSDAGSSWREGSGRSAGRRSISRLRATPRDKLEATVLAAEIDRAYLDWGLVALEGLEIDGAAATPAALMDRGPVETCGGDSGAHQSANAG